MDSDKARPLTALAIATLATAAHPLHQATDACEEVARVACPQQAPNPADEASDQKVGSRYISPGTQFAPPPASGSMVITPGTGTLMLQGHNPRVNLGPAPLGMPRHVFERMRLS